MDAERFQRVTELFRAACQLSGQERVAFLDEHCEHDHELRDEILAMLNHDEACHHEDASLAGVGAELLARVLAEEDGGSGGFDELPLRIGQYKIIRRVGEGGMGVVFEAMQQQPNRVVALKIIRPGLLSRQVARRFKYEAEVLGQLRHHGIAQVFEAGTAPIVLSTGNLPAQPFLAMEFVRGVPLLNFAANPASNGSRMALRRRLELFLQVCDALQHAHQSGVIHRDLKPDNIIVDERGQPKILDFGVARIVDRDWQATTLQTEVGQIVGTLAYMSPEQTQGEAAEIDIRSDVYAAGVVLYELLVDRLPINVRHRTISDAAQSIRSETPPMIGTLDPELRGDVETIVAKALAKEKERRYQTAGELSRDIRHHLAGEPIEARRDSSLYVLSKMIARHKAAVATALGCLLLVVGSTIALWFMYLQQSRATSLAQAEAIKANTVIELLQEMVGAADPEKVKGRDYTVRELLDQFAVALGDKLVDQPEVNATILATVGKAYLGLAEFEKAKSNLLKALQIRRELSGNNHPTVAASLTDLAILQMHWGKYREAEGLFRDALLIRQQHLNPPHADLAVSLNNLGEVLLRLGEYMESEKHLRRALAMRRELFGGRHATVAQSEHILALLLQHAGEPIEAERLYRQALGSNRELLIPAHPRIATNAYNLASILQSKGDFAGAENLFREALQINRVVYGEQHPSVSASLIGLASLLRSVGNLSEAESLYRTALATLRKLQGADHPDQALIMNNLANVLKDQGQYEEARELSMASLALRQRLFGDDHTHVANSLSNLAGLLKAIGSHREAESRYRQALAIARRHYSSDHPRLARILDGLGDLLVTMGRFIEARSCLEEALAININRYSSAHWRIFRTTSRLGQCLVAVRAYQEAESLLIGQFESLPADFKPKTAKQSEYFQRFISVICEIYDALNKPEEAAVWRARLPDSENLVTGGDP